MKAILDIEMGNDSFGNCATERLFEMRNVVEKLMDNANRIMVADVGDFTTAQDANGNTVAKLKIVADNEITEHEKLEYIHSTLQDVANTIEWAKLKEESRDATTTSAPLNLFKSLDEDMVNTSMSMIEDIREKHFDEGGELIITQGDKKLKEMLEGK